MLHTQDEEFKEEQHHHRSSLSFFFILLSVKKSYKEEYHCGKNVNTENHTTAHILQLLYCCYKKESLEKRDERASVYLIRGDGAELRALSSLLFLMLFSILRLNILQQCSALPRNRIVFSSLQKRNTTTYIWTHYATISYIRTQWYNIYSFLGIVCVSFAPKAPSFSSVCTADFSNSRSFPVVTSSPSYSTTTKNGKMGRAQTSQEKKSKGTHTFFSHATTNTQFFYYQHMYI